MLYIKTYESFGDKVSKYIPNFLLSKGKDEKLGKLILRKLPLLDKEDITFDSRNAIINRTIRQDDELKFDLLYKYVIVRKTTKKHISTGITTTYYLQITENELPFNIPGCIDVTQELIKKIYDAAEKIYLGQT